MHRFTPCAEIEGERLSLMPLRMEHVHTHFRWNNDEALNRLDSDAPFKREPFGAFLKRFEQLVYAPHPHERDFEIHTQEGRLVGVAYAENIQPSHRRCRVGVTVDQAEWGKGYGSEALELLLRYLFTEADVHRIAAEAFAFNAAWKRLLTRAGFRREGCLRDDLYRDGRWHDRETYALLEDEYHALRTGAIAA